MFSFTERGGWFAGDAFINWFKEILDADGRHLAHTTLAQFQKLRPTSELTVIAADTTGNERLVLNHRTAPDCPVIWAVRMSMSIPFLWQEVVWLPQWGPYRGRDITGHTIVDGGLLSNFAVDLLVSQEPDIQEIMGTAVGDVNPLGFLIDEKVPVPNSVEPPRSFNPLENVLPKLDVKQLQTIRRITQLVDTLMGASDTYVIRSHRHCVCRLPAEGYGTTEFLMTDQRLNALVAAGHETMRLFLQGDKSVNAEKENDRA
jgi:predicted acylesterase/phospholipase RssA